MLPVVSGLESRDQDVYRGQAEAVGMPAEERSHMRTLRALQHRTGEGPEAILDVEGWHRTNYGGSLRAAAFGANDGLVSNFSLVMGIAGANVEPRFVLLTGIAGLLAGASSMAAGEYVSVRMQRELYATMPRRVDYMPLGSISRDLDSAPSRFRELEAALTAEKAKCASLVAAVDLLLEHIGRMKLEFQACKN